MSAIPAVVFPSAIRESTSRSRVVRGQEESRYVKILSVREAKVRAAAPLPLQVDGELLGEREEVCVEMAGEKVEVWAPGRMAELQV